MISDNGRVVESERSVHVEPDHTARYTGDDITYSSRPGTNKGLRNSLLQDGDRPDSDRYPEVWERHAG